MRQFVILLCVSIVLYYSSQTDRVGYIPNLHFSSDQKWNDRMVEWHTEFLTALKEPSLYALSNNTYAHSYRFLWLRSFDNPIALRLSLNNDGSAILNVKVTNGEGGYGPGQLITSKTLHLTQAQVDEFLNLLEHANFWCLPTMDERKGLDGATWILEGIKGGKYQIVVKWSPEEGDFRKAALFLLELSELNIDSDRIY